MSKTTIDISTRTFIRFAAVILGFAAAIALVMMMRGGLVVLGIAAFLAIALNPLVRRIGRILPGKHRTIATALAYVLVVGVLTAFLSIAIPAVVSEAVRFVSALPSFVQSAHIDWQAIDGIAQNFGIYNVDEMIKNSLTAFSQSFVGNFGGAVFGSAATIGGFLANLVLILVLAFLMLIEGPRIWRWFWRIVTARMKDHDANVALAQKTQREVMNVVGRYVSGQMAVSAINWAMTTLAVVVVCLMFGLNVSLALPFGMLTALASLVPLFGSLVGGLLVALLLSFSSWPAGLAFLIYYLVYAQLEGNLIYPKIQGAGLKLPALAVLAAVTLGIYTFGLMGAVIAVPIAACIKVVLTNYTITGEPREPEKT
jgi:predicted PurR-regulated permease PerM